MIKLRKLIYLTVLVASILCSNLAGAVDGDKMPSGTVAIDETQFALIIGGSTGTGILNYGGKSYPFKINGMSVGVNIGASRVNASGEVYDLTDISKFPGIYTKVESGISIGGGVGGTILRNENGVIMRLSSTSEGLQLNISASGLSVKFDGR